MIGGRISVDCPNVYLPEIDGKSLGELRQKPRFVAISCGKRASFESAGFLKFHLAPAPAIV